MIEINDDFVSIKSIMFLLTYNCAIPNKGRIVTKINVTDLVGSWYDARQVKYVPPQLPKSRRKIMNRQKTGIER